MKIIHTADLHLESGMESRFNVDQARKRRSELLDGFEKIADYAAGVGAEVIMIAGDMFDKSSIRKTAIRRVFEVISTHPDITFIYLRGNHDCEAFDAELQGEDAPENILLFSSSKWTSYSFGDVVITGREINDSNEESIYSELVLDSGKQNIVMMHGQESMYEGKDKTHVINLKSLQNKYIDYLALGHIHSYKQDRLDERGIYCYPGCPEPRGFDECGKKGFVELDISPEGISTEFVSLQKRQFHEVEVIINPAMEMPDVINACEESIEGISAEDICRMVIAGYIDMESFIDSERIVDRFSDRFFFLQVKDSTSIKIEYENFAYDRSLKGSFVRLVQNLDMPEDEKAQIIDVGIRAIMGEDIS